MRAPCSMLATVRFDGRKKKYWSETINLVRFSYDFELVDGSVNHIIVFIWSCVPSILCVTRKPIKLCSINLSDEHLLFNVCLGKSWSHPWCHGPWLINECENETSRKRKIMMNMTTLLKTEVESWNYLHTIACGDAIDQWSAKFGISFDRCMFLTTTANRNRIEMNEKIGQPDNGEKCVHITIHEGTIPALDSTKNGQTDKPNVKIIIIIQRSVTKWFKITGATAQWYERYDCVSFSPSMCVALFLNCICSHFIWSWIRRDVVSAVATQ